MYDISIDIETLSSKPNALVTQIGACAFDRTSDVIHPAIFLVNCLNKTKWPVTDSYHVDQETVMWWMSQDKAAIDSLTSPAPVPTSDALILLNDWFKAIGFNFEYRYMKHYVWANSPQFDLTILRFAFAVERIDCPWHFRQEIDMRTILALAKERSGERINVDETGLVKHRADHDAIRQARTIQAATKILKDTNGQ